LRRTGDSTRDEALRFRDSQAHERSELQKLIFAVARAEFRRKRMG
jgi:hypothetical protein